MKNKHGNTISLCMIVRNEEKLLPRCLDSVKEIVNEIIIADTGSTDSTPEICRNFGAKLFSIDWPDDFSEARNFSISKAAGDWILALDADEYLTSENADKIKELVKSASELAFYLNFRSEVKNSAAGPALIHAHPRLFRNGLGIKYKGRIHEQIIESVTAAGGNISPTDIIVEHSGYIDGIMSGRGKIERNIRILKQELDDNSGKGIALFYLGESYSLLENWDEAIKYYKAGVNDSQIPPDNMALLYQDLGTAYFNTGNFAEALRCERKSLSLMPDRITPHVVLAETAMSMKNYDLAIWEFGSILNKIDENTGGRFLKLSDHLPDRNNITFRLGEAYYLSKDFEHAILSFENIVKNRPENYHAAAALAKTYFAGESYDSALNITDSIIKTNPDFTAALLIRGKSLSMLNKFDDAETCYKKILEIEPGNDEAKEDLQKIRDYLKKQGNSGNETGSTRNKSTHNSKIKIKAEELLRKGLPEKALEILKPLENELNNDQELCFLLAYCANELRNISEVISYSRKSIEIFDKDVRPHFLLGTALIQNQLYIEAVTALRNAVRLRPEMFEAWSAMGVAFVKTGDFQKAKDAFVQAHKLQPDNVQTLRNLAAVCGKLGLNSEAEKYLLKSKI